MSEHYDEPRGVPLRVIIVSMIIFLILVISLAIFIENVGAVESTTFDMRESHTSYNDGYGCEKGYKYCRSEEKCLHKKIECPTLWEEAEPIYDILPMDMTLKPRKELGLNNAIIKVNNEQSKKRINANLEKLQDRFRDKIQQYEDVIIEEGCGNTCTTRIYVIKESKFLGFIPTNKRFTYIIEDGELVRKKNFLEWLWLEPEEDIVDE